MMIRRMACFIFSGLFVSAVSLTVFGTQGQAEDANISSTSVPIMRLDEVRTGMRGTIKTVFRGSEIEQFGFEVLGIMTNALGPKQDIILVQLIGEKPEYTGVVAGMSGSPAYIDGKLVGALSLRFGDFAKEPIGGITPIETMLLVFEIQKAESRQPTSNRGMWREKPSNSSLLTEPAATSQPDGPHLLEPIPSPLFLTGLSQRVIDRFGSFFKQHGLVPIRAGSTSAGEIEFDPNDVKDFVPGAAIAAVLATGDLGIYATGTVSYRDGDRILAFGHPFLQMGGVDMPMAKATILTTLASQWASFKLASQGKIVGSIRQDRLTGIMGQIGAKPKMISVNVKVRTPTRGVVPYHYEIFQHPALTPLLLNITLFSSISQALEQSNVLTLAMQGKIHVDGHPDLSFKDIFTAGDDSFLHPVALDASGRIVRLFSLLFNNRLVAPTISGLEVDFNLSEERRAATLEELRVSKQVIQPGEGVDVYAFLRPYRGEVRVEKFRLRIPENVRRGQRLTLTVGDAPTVRATDYMDRVGHSDSLDALIQLLNRQRTNDRLYLRLTEYAPGYLIDDHLMPALPLSVLSVIESGQMANQHSRVDQSVLREDWVEVGYFVRGRRQLVLQVR